MHQSILLPLAPVWTALQCTNHPILDRTSLGWDSQSWHRQSILTFSSLASCLCSTETLGLGLDLDFRMPTKSWTHVQVDVTGLLQASLNSEVPHVHIMRESTVAWVKEHCLMMKNSRERMHLYIFYTRRLWRSRNAAMVSGNWSNGRTDWGWDSLFNAFLNSGISSIFCLF